MAPLKPTGFWSYASRDDAASEGRLSQLRRLLANQLQGHVGRAAVHIFQDVAAIPPGTEWERQIDQALQQSSFFIPIITPSFLHSEWCAREVIRFREIMQRSGRLDLILPIHYLDVDGFDSVRREECFDPAVLTYLRSLQWVNFRPLRLRDPGNEEVQRALEEIATGILHALYRENRPPEAPPDPPQRRQTAHATQGAPDDKDPAEDPTGAAPPPPAPWRRRGWGLAAGSGALAICLGAYLELRGPVTPLLPAHLEAAASMPADVAPTQRPSETTHPLAAATDGPDGAVAITLTPAPPVEQSRSLTLMPLPEPPAMPPRPTLLPLELAQAAAQSLPCSMLNITNGQDGTRVSGLAMAGPALDQLLAELHTAGHVADDITRLDRFACPPLAMVETFVQRSRTSTPPAFAIQLEQRRVRSGAPLEINVTKMPAALYVDLYEGDGSVRHLSRPVPGIPSKSRVEWMATPPTGPSLIVAIGAAAPLDLGARPATEQASVYVAALRTRLQGAAEPLVADLAMVTVLAAETKTVKLPVPHVKDLQREKCENIASRAQLGDILSDAELAALRTECRS